MGRREGNKLTDRDQVTDHSRETKQGGGERRNRGTIDIPAERQTGTKIGKRTNVWITECAKFREKRFLNYLLTQDIVVIGCYIGVEL